MLDPMSQTSCKCLNLAFLEGIVKNYINISSSKYFESIF